MKTIITSIAIFFTLLVYCMGQDKAKQDSIIDIADTIGTRKTLNEIRFNGCERSEWLDNEYIRTLRKYLDDYNDGIVANPALDPYREQIKSQFVVCNIRPCLLGGSPSSTCPTEYSAVGYTATWINRKKLLKAMNFALSTWRTKQQA